MSVIWVRVSVCATVFFTPFLFYSVVFIFKIPYTPSGRFAVNTQPLPRLWGTPTSALRDFPGLAHDSVRHESFSSTPGCDEHTVHALILPTSVPCLNYWNSVAVFKKEHICILHKVQFLISVSKISVAVSRTSFELLNRLFLKHERSLTQILKQKKLCLLDVMMVIKVSFQKNRMG